MTVKKKFITCEQLYEIWSSEPEVISIFDLRDIQSFNELRIPGSISMTEDKLENALGTIGNNLAVLVGSSVEDEKKILQKLTPRFSNFLILNKCERWKELKFPLINQSIQDILKNMSEVKSMKSDTLFFQLFEPTSSTYTYIIGDSITKEAAIIDPVIETFDRDLKFINELGLKLLYILDTHVHADHITSAFELRKLTGAKTAISHLACVECVDLLLEDGQELKLGNKTVKAITTPGHTNSCMSYYFEGRVFSGDTLLIRGCGRTDFQQGSSEKLYHSVHQKLFNLPDDTIVFPGHDYRGFTSSTIALEKKFNPRLALKNSLEDFKKIMSELNLPYPKKIDVSLPANLKCGNITYNRIMKPQVVNDIPEVSCEDVYKHKTSIRLIDVRRPDEFNGELAHIEGAELVTLGEDLSIFLNTIDKNQEIAFICRSCGRSGQATLESIKLGFTKTVNMVGGMILWNEKHLPTIKE
jgi:glyoxylase-like metal-dependent hydrolase (beta-lactamase superfamily II)/rhodanese-related sulfurtransferase